MERFQSHALVLSTLDYGESDRIVTLFTAERGRLSAFAKGARRSRRRFAGMLEPFAWIAAELVETHGTTVRLDEASLVEPFAPLREALPRAVRGFHAMELLKAVCKEREAHPELFRHAIALLRSLAFEGGGARELLHFELRVLEQAGFRPSFDACGGCGKSDGELRFDPARGGVSCPECSAFGMRVGRGTIAALRALQRAERASEVAMEPHARAEARRLLDRFFAHHVGTPLRSLELFATFDAEI